MSRTGLSLPPFSPRVGGPRSARTGVRYMLGDTRGACLLGFAGCRPQQLHRGDVKISVADSISTCTGFPDEIAVIKVVFNSSGRSL